MFVSSRRAAESCNVKLHLAGPVGVQLHAHLVHLPGYGGSWVSQGSGDELPACRLLDNSADFAIMVEVERMDGPRSHVQPPKPRSESNPGATHPVVRELPPPKRYGGFQACTLLVRCVCVSKPASLPLHLLLVLSGFDRQTGPAVLWVDV